MNGKIMIATLKRETEDLLELVYGQRIVRRQSIIQDLIRRGCPADDAIEEAEKLCTFIESGKPTIKQTKIKKAKTKPQSSVKGKRKYTKRSKFWSKK